MANLGTLLLGMMQKANHITFASGSSLGSGNGWIQLVLIEERDLVATDLRGTSDPYVRVHYGNFKKRTKELRNGTL
ncbi:hypothetical protein RJT34_19884 [Clitoria ternatea]|uniref:C2 domain-containing protein n=1 Tax=Clitoria ternatea TaxID=43366 RepID=A0AAN9P553_CLITE